MLTVELKSRDDRLLAQFAILPMPGLPQSLVDEQYKLASMLMAGWGARFFFLVTSDYVYGWASGQKTPFFKQPTEKILAKYAGGDPNKVHEARSDYLAGLVEAWLADLSFHWKSGADPVPAERELRDAGLFGEMRAP
ncbi:MAG TPA: hypothetical protein VEU33_24390 [Archangium sp.]|nr:hypothetical protein [Archangium sp.]